MKYWIILILLICFGCKNAKPKSFIGNIDINRKLNLKIFKIVNDTAKYFSQDTVFVLSLEKKHYKLTTKHKQDNLRQIVYYNKKTLYPEITCYFLADIAVGSLKIYENHDKIIFENNFEKDYPFTSFMLVDKFKEEYGIDLLKQKNIYIARKKNYEVDMYNNPDTYSYRHFEIDGKTGDILTDTIGKIKDMKGLIIK